ncbi:FAD-dependent 5-carboxymethylaminomethyl-2-thiouridine(34) oxidoreductase MnmC [bacterium]|nr:FAD-dependent 5-carboxymethylaminomethyl-2-thiouridine(34) oxidoreductase MnmC [bacterium]
MVKLLPTPAAVEWKDGALPCSAQYGDVYYSAENGLEEARYVFLAQNGLPGRLADCDRFTLAETGFGTGLNFLALWQMWKALPEPRPDLCYITTELHPMRPEDMARAHAVWPELAELSAALLRAYPHPFPGEHVRYLEGGRIELRLLLGDAVECLAAFGEAHCVDAWFLDGFAPAGNEGMWTQALFAEMARMSKAGATLASFTAAGHVRRGLAAAGFLMEKARGFGRKRDMLKGVYRIEAAAPAMVKGSQPAVVIGGGVAGVGAAWHLARQGREVVMLEAGDDLAAGASGNPAAAFAPYFTADWSERGQLYARGFGHARHIWQGLKAEGFQLEGELCGVLALEVDKPGKDRHARLLAKLSLPDSVMRKVSREEARYLAGVDVPAGGVFYGEGGWMCMKSLCRALLTHAGESIEFMPNSRVTQLEHDGIGWRVSIQGQCHAMLTDHVVLATGFGAKALLPDLPLEAVRGQLISFRPDDRLARLKTVINWGEYLTPLHDGRMVLGSSFVRHDALSDIRNDEVDVLLGKLKQIFPGVDAKDVKPWAAIRCATPQRMPLMGDVRAFLPQMPAGLYLHLAHGSRGTLTGLLDGGHKCSHFEPIIHCFG